MENISPFSTFLFNFDRKRRFDKTFEAFFYLSYTYYISLILDPQQIAHPISKVKIVPFAYRKTGHLTHLPRPSTTYSRAIVFC